MATLIIDIETVGEDFDSLDEYTKGELTKNISAEKGSTAYDEELAEVKRNLVFSPLTGHIVAIGVLDVEKGQAAVYFQAPGQKLEEYAADQVKYKPMTERQMLESFWGGAAAYDTFVTWNGRAFDVPYLVTRSAVHEVPISRDLMTNRYLSSQRFGAKHIDLFDQVSFYGALRRPGSLHMWCRAMGIPTPKDGAVSASHVGEAFAAGKYQEIAEYNAKDLFATRQIYERWRKYFIAA